MSVKRPGSVNMPEQTVSCRMCGKNILDLGEIFKRKINSKCLEFDSLNCADIYERLQSVYGNSIEI